LHRQTYRIIITVTPEYYIQRTIIIIVLYYYMQRRRVMTGRKIIIILHRTQNVNAQDLQASSLQRARKTIIVTRRRRVDNLCKFSGLDSVCVCESKIVNIYYLPQLKSRKLSNCYDLYVYIIYVSHIIGIHLYTYVYLPTYYIL